MAQLLCISSALYAAALLLFPAALTLYLSGQTTIIDWKILSLERTSVYASAILDPIRLIFSFTVMFIAANVYLFAVGYIAEDQTPHRFGQNLFLFVLSMNFLVYSPNLISLLLGWDGLGLTSFLLVIYYQNSYSVGAGIITALTNRIGDVAIILGIATMLTNNSWHLFSQTPLPLVTALVILAAITKSAQFPFCSWLPMAMAAPTPVSALVHSSTLVTAGIFLLIRFYPVLSTFPSAHLALLITGTITILLAGISASVEFDFKKIVAFSTLSQLGVIVFRLGLGMPNLAFFHLLTHAIFKALLFLCVGTAIHIHAHIQDLRVMGNLPIHVPTIQSGILLANLALCGVPFLRGFYSKDIILEFGLTANLAWTLIFLIITATILTSTYSVRRIIVTQANAALRPSLSNMQANFLHFSAPVTALRLIALTWGATLNWTITPTYAPCLRHARSALPLLIILVGVIIAALSLQTSVTHHKLHVPSIAVQTVRDAAANMWFLTTFSSQYIINSPLKLGFNLLSTTDQGWVEQTVRQAANVTIQSTLQQLKGLTRNPPTTLLLLAMLVTTPFIVMSL